VVLRAVVELSGSARSHCLGPSVVSGDLERMSQCTSRPTTTTSSWTLDSASTALSELIDRLVGRRGRFGRHRY
jgi:hypothetical protein